MSVENGELLQRIGVSAYRKAPEGWTKITVRLFGLGAAVDVEASSTADENDEPSGFWLDRSGIDACGELRKAMYRPGAGTWYLTTLTIDRDGELEADFDYEGQPFKDEDFDEAWLQVMENEQRLFPRDAEHLPAWFTSRMAEQ